MQEREKRLFPQEKRATAPRAPTLEQAAFDGRHLKREKREAV